MPEQRNRINNKIHDYLEGTLSSQEVDDLWAELLGDEEGYEYLETLTLLRKMGSEGQLTGRNDEDNGTDQTGKVREKKSVYYIRYAAAVAATILITVLAVQQTDLYNNSVPSAPITSIDYGIERSGEVMNHIESIKGQVIELTDSGKTDDAVLFLNDQLSGEDFTDIQKNELQILKGSLYYNNGRYSDAKEVFQEGLEQIDRQTDFVNYERNLWFFANTLLQLDEKDLAIERMKEVVQLDGSFGRVAENLLSIYNE